MSEKKKLSDKLNEAVTNATGWKKIALYPIMLYTGPLTTIEEVETRKNRERAF